MKSKKYLVFSFVLLLIYSSFSVAGDISDSAFNGKLDEVKALAKSGADVNMVDENGNRPIISAVEAQNYEIVEFLLSIGAKVDAKNSYGQTALTMTCEEPVFKENAEKLLKIAKLLIKHGANVNHVDGDGIPLLKYCIENEADKSVIKLLKDNGAK